MYEELLEGLKKNAEKLSELAERREKLRLEKLRGVKQDYAVLNANIDGEFKKLLSRLIQDGRSFFYKIEEQSAVLAGKQIGISKREDKVNQETVALEEARMVLASQADTLERGNAVLDDKAARLELETALLRNQREDLARQLQNARMLVVKNKRRNAQVEGATEVREKVLKSINDEIHERACKDLEYRALLEHLERKIGSCEREIKRRETKIAAFDQREQSLRDWERDLRHREYHMRLMGPQHRRYKLDKKYREEFDRQWLQT